jgi:hypothetical protein
VINSYLRLKRAEVLILIVIGTDFSDFQLQIFLHYQVSCRGVIMLRFVIYASFVVLMCDGATIPRIDKNLNCDGLPQEIIDDIASYRPVVNRIIDSYLNGPYKGQTYKL